MFDADREGMLYSYQICHGYAQYWENILYTIIITTNNKVIGYGQLLLKPAIGELFNIIVDPEYRQHGIGSEIVTELEDYAVKKNKSKFNLWCEKQVIPFYSKLGYFYNQLESTMDGVELFRMTKPIRNMVKF